MFAGIATSDRCMITYLNPDYLHGIMKVDDNAIFREYYDLKQHSGIPFIFFFHSRHLVGSPRKFYLKYRSWLLTNDLEDIYHSSWDYLLWIMNHFSATGEEREMCKRVHSGIGNTKLPFSELCVAASIFTISSGQQVSAVVQAVGLSSDPVARCRSAISGLGLSIPAKEVINTFPLSSEQ